MVFSELSRPWQRVFELAWLSLCEGSKAIGAVIVNEEGEIVSEGRNRIYEGCIPNPAVWHAEVEAVRSLDLTRFPNPKAYTLYAGLEPCPMCMGTLVMGHIRHVVMGAKDTYGGAMELLNHSPFLQKKQVQVTWAPEEYGHMQRAFQTLWALLYHENEEKTKQMLEAFSVYYKPGVEAAKKLLEEGYFEGKIRTEISAEEVFDELAKRL